MVLQELCTGSPGLEPASIVPTVGLNVGRVEAHHAQLLFWDLGGQAGLRSIWDKYFADSHALIFVVDSTRPARCSAWQWLPATVGAIFFGLHIGVVLRMLRSLSLETAVHLLPLSCCEDGTSWPKACTNECFVAALGSDMRAEAHRVCMSPGLRKHEGRCSAR